MKRVIGLLGMLLLFFAIASSAHAQLIVRGSDSLGNKLIYDVDRDITWYDYTKSGDGYDNQMSWAAGLSVTYNGGTIDDWRLPNKGNVQYTGGSIYNDTSSEMGHLYYEELGLENYIDRRYSYNTTADINLFGFDNLLPYEYWAIPEFVSDGAWIFDMNKAFMFVAGDSNPFYGLAVRSGDVSAVPIPGAIWLFGTGLLGLTGIRRKNR